MSRQLWIILLSTMCMVLAEEETASDTKAEEAVVGKASRFDATIDEIVTELDLTTNGANSSQIRDRIAKFLRANCNSCLASGGGSALEQGYATTENEVKIPVVYEQTRHGGGWIVLMQRYDGTVNFNRTWAEYRDGFGMVGHEFWMGLERIHRLTTAASYELMFEMEDFEGNYKYAGYDAFVVGPAEERYKLTTVGAISGTTENSFGQHVGYGFSTYDNDNSGCSNKYGRGGWWYYGTTCYGASLTGIWQNKTDWKSICWGWFSGTSKMIPLKFARMMMRLKTVD